VGTAGLEGADLGEKLVGLRGGVVLWVHPPLPDGAGG
jgi:hypothetical protein